jgi:type IV pilus assembly protein PilM
VGRDIVGLEVGASKLGAARVASNGSAKLLQIATAPLMAGVVSGGEVRDPEALGAAIRDLFARHKLPRRAVRVGVANNRVGVRTIDVPGIEDPKQLGNAVRFRAQEALPIPLTEAVLDYQVLSTGKDEEGQTVRKVLFAVVYRDLVEGYTEACKQAGVRLVGIDLEGFALLRALTPIAAEPPAEKSALVCVNLGSERSVLAVTDGSVAEFTRVLEWGGSTLTAAIARDLGIEPDDAERLKRAVSLDSFDVPEGTDDAHARQARESILLNLQAFARELVSSLQFYQNQPGSYGIREICLSGGTAKLGGLAEALQRMVAVRVTVGDPTVNLSARKVRGGEPDPSLAIAIGLGMGA